MTDKHEGDRETARVPHDGESLAKMMKQMRRRCGEMMPHGMASCCGGPEEEKDDGSPAHSPGTP
jgi:hypothetical protein